MYQRGHYITKLKHAVLVIKYVFSYLPPHVKRVEIAELLQMYQKLFGDINILSKKPKWALFSEIRKGRIGGMESMKRSKLHDFPSDHYAMITPV
jgi:hypothetical protein